MPPDPCKLFKRCLLWRMQALVYAAVLTTGFASASTDPVVRTRFGKGLNLG